MPDTSGRVQSDYVITVEAFDMTSEQAEALFDRVAEAAHALDEQVTVGSGRLSALPEGAS